MIRSFYIAVLATSLLGVGVAQAQQGRNEASVNRYVASTSDNVVLDGMQPSDGNAQKVMGLSVPNGFRTPLPQDGARR